MCVAKKNVYILPRYWHFRHCDYAVLCQSIKKVSYKYENSPILNSFLTHALSFDWPLNSWFSPISSKKIQRSFATTLRLLCRFSILSLVLMKTSTFEYCFTISIFPLLALNSQLIQRDFRKSGGVPNSIFKMICPETVHKCDETHPTPYWESNISN